MNAQPNREVALFSAALELPANQRAAYLAEACADDPALRLRVEALLRVHQEALPFLEAPAPGAQESPPGAAVSAVPQQPAGSHAEQAGGRIGRYKLLQQIGEGGCGVVYMAEQEEPVRRRVALKVVKLGMDTKQVIGRFEAERQALALMDHPNIAKVLDAGATETGRPYFVMELVRGIKITDYCDQNNLPTRERLELFTQVCQAVQHAHQKGVIHRDIKPSNILVASNDGAPVPKVIDFGIAKATQGRLTDQTVFTAFEQFIGTPAYMSPEQAALTMLDIDTRTDIYSLGVLLYELLTGRTPFDAKELAAAGLDAMRRTIREKEPPRPSTRLSTMLEGDLTTTAKHRHTDPPKLIHLLRGDLDWIVMKALEKERARRYETANGLAMDVQRYLTDEPVVASPPSATYKLRKLARRHRIAVRVTIAFVLLLMAAAIISSWQAVRAMRARSDALVQKRRADEQAALAEGVSQFFSEEVFGLADPKRFDRAGITLVEALDVAAAKIDTRFPNDPRLRGTVRDRFGEIYDGIDRPQKAVEQLQKAVELRTSVAGGKEPSTLKSRTRLGWALFKAGRRGEARDVLETTLAEQSKVLGGGHPDAVESACYLATVLREIRGGWWGSFTNAPEDNKDLEVPRKAYRQALAALGPLHHSTLNAESSLAWAMRWRQDSAGALPYAREAALGLQKTRGGDDHEATWATYNYAVCLTEIGHPQEAVAQLKPVLAARYRLLGPSHMDTLVAAWRLAETLRIIGEQEKSLAVLEDVRAHLEDIQAARTWQRGEKLLDLAGSYRALQRYDRAAELVASASRMADPPPDQETQRRGYAAWLNRLASMMLTVPEAQCDDARAVEIATRACELTGYSKGPFVSTLLAALAQQAAATGGQTELVSSYQNILAEERKAPGNDNPAVAETLSRLADAFQAQGRQADAEKALQEALPIQRRSVEQEPGRSDNRVGLGHLLWRLGRRLRDSGRNNEALQAYGEAVQVFEQAARDFPAEPFLRQEQGFSRRQLGDVLNELGRGDEAEQQYREAIKLYTALVADVPQNAFYRQEEAYTAWMLAVMLERAGRRDAATTEYRRAIALHEKASAAFPDQPEIKSRLAQLLGLKLPLPSGQLEKHD